VLSSSAGSCEHEVTAEAPGLTSSESTLFEQAATEGMSVLVAAGDAGSAACRQSGAGTELSVQDPAGQPFVTAVGGTSLTALGPPPTETAWNEAQKGGGAGGGGISALWPMPTWQVGGGAVDAYSSGEPCGAASGYCREVPDVAASADAFHGYEIYHAGGWVQTGGTSASAPLWAALIALVDSGPSPPLRLGLVTPALYHLHSSVPSAFNDVTTGDNDFTGTNGGRYPAAAGYDMATGLGTPVAAVLAGALRALAS
jgi:kumamolisin